MGRFQFNHSTFLVVVLAFAISLLFMAHLSVVTIGQAAATAAAATGPRDHLSSVFTMQQAQSSNTKEYDIVTLVHHSDMAPFIAYGLRSWIIHLKDLSKNANIFIICNPQAYDAVQFHLQQEEASGHETAHNIIPVHEEVYPFSLQSVTNQFTWKQKPTWVYQQLLKLYSHQVLEEQHKLHPHKIPRIKEWFTIIDSDTIFVQPFSIFNTHKGTEQSYPLYNVAAPNTGAFKNDAILGQFLIDEVFRGMKMLKAFPNYHENVFTAIAHFMTFHGPSLYDMLQKIDEIQDMPAWKFLCKLKKSVLSEWELYLAWVMHFQRETVHVRPIPYVNWGLLEHSNLIDLNNQTLSDIVYLSKHDDYQVGNKCCVNSDWQQRYHLPNCPCCEKSDCTRIAIDCQTLGGNQGCNVIDISDDGIHTMAFEPLSHEEQLKRVKISEMVSSSEQKSMSRLKKPKNKES